MSRRFAILAVGCVVAFACVAVAYGAANKIKEFETCALEPPEADGMAILNYDSEEDKTVFQLILSDFSAYADYDIVLVGADSWFLNNNNTPDDPTDDYYQATNMALTSFTDNLDTGELRTDAKGNLTFHASSSGFDFSESDVLVFSDGVGTSYHGISTPDDPTDDYWVIRGDLRAVGYLNPE